MFSDFLLFHKLKVSECLYLWCFLGIFMHSNVSVLLGNFLYFSANDKQWKACFFAVAYKSESRQMLARLVWMGLECFLPVLAKSPQILTILFMFFWTVDHKYKSWDEDLIVCLAAIFYSIWKIGFVELINPT